jgi:hypothetical protein
MVTSFDTDDMLFRALSGNAGLVAAISGGIYTTGRPDSSEKEDITVGAITITGGAPQRGTSNVNIYVPDVATRIGGQEQRQANRERLRELTDMVISILEATTVDGAALWVANETVLKEAVICQHYTNLRIEWNIQRINN